MKRVWPLVVVVWAWALAGAGQAQILTGSIIGTVKDESGAVLPGVTVTLTSPRLPAGPVTVVTNEKGEYRFTDLNPGTYGLTASLSGFSTYQEDGLRVGVSSTVERIITVKLATVAETITVSGESPMVDPRKVGVTTNFAEEVVELLPIKRNTMTEFVKWAPGVSSFDPSGDSGTVAVMGSGTGENSILMDGIMTNDPSGGLNWGSGDMHAVEEIQVVTLGASAEYQVAQGGVFNVVYKSGTNTYDLDGYAYWYPDGLTSKPVKLNCNCSFGETGYTVVKFRDWVLHGGGPIKKDKLWFFGGGRYQAKTIAQPGIDWRLPLLRTSHDLIGKVTWQINDRVKFANMLHMEPWENPGTPTPARPHATATASGGDPGMFTYKSEVTATLSSNILLTARATGWLSPYGFSRPLSGDRVTPFRLDQLTNIACCGVQQFGDVILGRHGQAAKVNWYMDGPKVTHDIRFGVQIEQGLSENYSAFPSGVQYADLGGAPDQATFRSPFVNGAESSSQGLWAEDQITMGGRFTLGLGLRYDRQKGVSPDLPAVDNLLEKTGATIQGLGDMFTWNSVAPRVGFNLKVTEDGKTVLRGTYGRAYRPIFLNEFINVHPGISPTTLARWSPATQSYSTIISVTDPRANIAVDPDVKAPYTDQVSFGIDRELRANFGVGATYVYKNGKYHVGWEDIGGVYGTRTEVLPDGRTLTVFPLLNRTSERRYLQTNGPGFYNRYNGLVLTADKRWSQRWQAHLSYTISKAEGLVIGGTASRDPNALINADGRLSPQDRPHMFTAVASYEVPKVDVMMSANFMAMSGTPYAPQALVSLPQGRLSINIEPPGTYRQTSTELLHVRFTKNLFQRAGRRIEVGTEVRNALQEKVGLSIVSANFFAATFGQPSQWIEPRQMYFWVRVVYQSLVGSRKSLVFVSRWSDR